MENEKCCQESDITMANWETRKARQECSLLFHDICYNLGLWVKNINRMLWKKWIQLKPVQKGSNQVCFAAAVIASTILLQLRIDTDIC